MYSYRVAVYQPLQITTTLLYIDDQMARPLVFAIVFSMYTPVHHPSTSAATTTAAHLGLEPVPSSPHLPPYSHPLAPRPSLSLLLHSNSVPGYRYLQCLHLHVCLSHELLHEPKELHTNAANLASCNRMKIACRRPTTP